MHAEIRNKDPMRSRKSEIAAWLTTRPEQLVRRCINGPGDRITQEGDTLIILRDDDRFTVETGQRAGEWSYNGESRTDLTYLYCAASGLTFREALDELDHWYEEEQESAVETAETLPAQSEACCAVCEEASGDSQAAPSPVEIEHSHPLKIVQGASTDRQDTFSEDQDSPPVQHYPSAPPAETSSGGIPVKQKAYERQPQPASAEPARLVRRRGWFKVGKADICLLNERCGASAASIKSVWLALLTLENDRSSASFQVETNVIRRWACLSLRTTKSALYKLEKLGFVGIERLRVPGKKENDANIYTILRSCSDFTTPSCNKRTTGRANEEPLHLHGNSKESAKACHKSKRGERVEVAAGADLNGSAHRDLLSKPRIW